MEPRRLRHARALLLRSDLRRARNAALVESEYRRRKVELRGRPYLFFVDVCNRCDLRCPLCPSALPSFKRPRGMIRLAEYERLLDEIAPWALEVNLHNWGEPLLNPDVFAIVAATRERGVSTNLSSNLNALGEDRAEDVVRSGLDYLVVSIDGATPDEYARYRVRGDLRKVLRNLRAIVAAKRGLRSRTPIIEWQFLVMRHNEHQTALVRRMAREIGVDAVRFTSAGLPFEEFGDRELAEAWMPADRAYWDLNPLLLGGGRDYLRDARCFYLYRSMTVNPGGGVAPCCVLYDEAEDFGNIAAEGLDAVWNNARYRAARALFAGTAGGSGVAGTACAGCALFRRPQSPERGGGGRTRVKEAADG